MLEVSENLKQIYRTNIAPLVKSFAEMRLDIYFPGLNLHIYNEQIVDDSFELTESLCSSTDITFGVCEAAEIKFTLADITVDLFGQVFTVTQTVNGIYTMPLGTYTVDSAKRQDNLRFIDVVGYDAIRSFDIDVSAWYNALTFPLPLREFRLSLCRHLGVVPEEQSLCNDGISIEQTIKPASLVARDVMEAIGEINCAFGHMTREGRFKFIEFSGLGLYPAENLYPEEDLYPKDPDEEFGKENVPYVSTRYEDYIVEEITGIQIRAESGDAGVVVGNIENVYIAEANFLCYGKSASELSEIANKMLKLAKNQFYRPHNTVIPGLPYLEVGDSVLIRKEKDAVESYVFMRTLKGIQSLTDEISATGEQFRGNQVSPNTQIEQLKGKTAILTRDVDGIRSDVGDLETQTNTRFEQTADMIQTEANRASEAEGKLSSTITQTAESIRQEVSQTAENLSTLINQTANAIEIEANRATEAEGELSGKISVQANQIALKVSKGNVSSEISVESDQVYIGSNRLVVDSTNFKLDSAGNATFSGTVQGARIVGGSIVLDGEDFCITISPSLFNVAAKNTSGKDLFKISSPDQSMSFGANRIIFNDAANGCSAVVSSQLFSVNQMACQTLNGYTPVTAGNIENYIGNLSTRNIYGSPGGTSGQIAFSNANVTGWDYAQRTFATKSDISLLQTRISALENQIASLSKE